MGKSLDKVPESKPVTPKADVAKPEKSGDKKKTLAKSGGFEEQEKRLAPEDKGAAGERKMVNAFSATVHIFSKEEGGLDFPLIPNGELEFFFARDRIATGQYKLDDVQNLGLPGMDHPLTVKLLDALALHPGDPFIVRVRGLGGRNLGSGALGKVLD